ncbi:MAG TPA: glycosyltransferase [Methylomirabilota bacterium]|nr:glycosyltransferase [Methylomirabilota bacterium]
MKAIASALHNRVPAPAQAEASPAPAESVDRTPAGPAARAAARPGVLLIAYHYPPCGFSSGLQRTFCFSRDLRAFGWAPLVLTVHPRAFPQTRTDQLAQIPADVPVHAAFALDTPRHLGIRGRYFGWMALPDNWVSWLPGAVASGLRMIRRYRPRVLWSTYPIASAHLVGLALQRMTGIPWVADFRDPMTEEDPLTGQRFPDDPRLFRVRRWVERQTIRRAARSVFVTPGSLEIHRQRYPQFAGRMSVIGNGFDEETFAAAERLVPRVAAPGGRLLLIHSGVLYPGPDRDPTAFFAALASLKAQGRVSGATLHVRLRASGYDDYYRRKIQEHGIADIVTLDPATPYLDALAEMLAADGLLVFQGRTSNPAVPAKLYEYLRARRPIFALVDAEGDTSAVLRRARSGTQVPLDDPRKIEQGLVRFLEDVRRGASPLPDPQDIAAHSRVVKARELAALLGECVDAEAGAPAAAAARGEET